MSQHARVRKSPHGGVFERLALGRGGQEQRHRLELRARAEFEPDVDAGDERHLALRRAPAEEHVHPPTRRRRAVLDARTARGGFAVDLAVVHPRVRSRPSLSLRRRRERSVDATTRARQRVPQHPRVRQPNLRRLQEQETGLLHAADDVHVREHRLSLGVRNRRVSSPFHADVSARHEEPVQTNEVAETEARERLRRAFPNASNRVVAEPRGGVILHLHRRQILPTEVEHRTLLLGRAAPDPLAPAPDPLAPAPDPRAPAPDPLAPVVLPVLPGRHHHHLGGNQWQRSVSGLQHDHRELSPRSRVPFHHHAIVEARVEQILRRARAPAAPLATTTPTLEPPRAGFTTARLSPSSSP